MRKHELKHVYIIQERTINEKEESVKWEHIKLKSEIMKTPTKQNFI
jgi:hypothetical protein